MGTTAQTFEIEDAVDRLLEQSRPSFRHRAGASAVADLDPVAEPRPAAPAEMRIASDAAVSRIVLVIPRHGGPDASCLLRWLVRGGTGDRNRAANEMIHAEQPDDFRWSARTGPTGGDCEAFVELLPWDDLPAAALPAAVRRGFGSAARTAWTFLSTGTLSRLWNLRRTAVLAAAARLAPLAVQLLIALAIGLVSGSLLRGALTPLAALAGLPAWPVTLVAAIAGASAVVLILRFFRRNEDRLDAYAHARGLGYLASARGAYPGPLEERIAAFAERIGWALRQPVDEVLVVGQGEGTALAVSALAEAVQWGELPDGAPKVSLLTLGQSIPLLSFLPDAGRLRADLRDISLRGDICWIDVSDPADHHAFALCDPVAVSGVALDDRRGPLVLASSFGRHRGSGIASLWRDNGLNIRDRYLMSLGDAGRDYDWRRVILGSLPLCKLLGGRPPAKGRIDLRASAYVSTSRPRPEPDEDD